MKLKQNILFNLLQLEQVYFILMSNGTACLILKKTENFELKKNIFFWIVRRKVDRTIVNLD